MGKIIEFPKPVDAGPDDRLATVSWIEVCASCPEETTCSRPWPCDRLLARSS